MAIAYDTVSSTGGSGTDTVTLSHTCSGSDRVLIVNIGIHGNARVINSVKYNGVDMTLAADEIYAPNNLKLYQYYLIAPATGAHNIVVVFDGNTDYSVVGISLTGAHQTSPIGASGGGTASTSNPSDNITTTFANSIIVAGVIWSGSSAGAPSATGTNQTTRASGTSPAEYGSSTQTTTTTGSYTSSWTDGASLREVQSMIEIKEKPASTNYPITAAQGSFTLTGQSALLKIGYKIVSAFGSFVLTGQNVALKLGYGLVASYGSFILTGQDAILRIAMRMIAAQGSFVQTMQTVIMMYGKTMQAAYGSFVLTGQSILLKLGWKITAAQGSFTIAGQSILLNIGRIMQASYNSFVLTGQNVLLKIGWKMQAVYTTFTLTGQTVLLKVGKYMSAVYGTFTLTGQTVLFHIGRIMQAVYGQITLTGQSILFAVNGLYVRWTTAVKNAVATLTNRAKNSSTWTNRDKTL